MRNWGQYLPDHHPDPVHVRRTASGSVSSGRRVPVHGRLMSGEDAPVTVTRAGRVVLRKVRKFQIGYRSAFEATPELLAAFRYRWA